MADFSKTPESKNFVDLTAVSGATRERINMLRNFLMSQILNRRSLPPPEMGNGEADGWVQLPEGRDFPFRPVEGPNGNVVRDLLTNPDYVRDNRNSDPQVGSEFFKMMIADRKRRLLQNKRGSTARADEE